MEKAPKRTNPTPVKETKTLVPTRRVVDIAKRNLRARWDTISQSVYNGGDNSLSVPVKRNVAKIRIRSRRIKQLIGKRVLVIMDKWDRNAVHPSGHILRERDYSADTETETDVIVTENAEITRSFSDAAMECLPEASWKVNEDH